VVTLYKECSYQVSDVGVPNTTVPFVHHTLERARCSRVAPRKQCANIDSCMVSARENEGGIVWRLVSTLPSHLFD
jgi:hypothetical protein